MSIPAQGETELLLFPTARQRASGPTAARLFASLRLPSEDPGGRSVRSEGEISLNYHIRKQATPPLLLITADAVPSYTCVQGVQQQRNYPGIAVYKKCLALRGEKFWANV